MDSKTELSSKNRRVLITGANGFIGSWIVKRLVEQGESPWVYDLDIEARRLRALLAEDKRAAVHFVRGDILSFDDLDRVVAEQGITHLIHLAALQVPACAADPILGSKINVVGTINVFETARKRRDTVQRVVYASSVAVFGPEEFYGPGSVPEGAQLQPMTHYGVFKQANEGAARVYAATQGIPSIGLRPSTVYGVGRDQGLTSGPTKAIKACVVGRPYTIRFTGGFDMHYARDTADLFIRSAESHLDGARAYSPRGAVVRMNAYLETLARILPKAKTLIRAEGPQLPIAFDFDESALTRDFGQLPKTPLEEGIRETAQIFERQLREGTLDTRDLES